MSNPRAVFVHLLDEYIKLDDAYEHGGPYGGRPVAHQEKTRAEWLRRYDEATERQRDDEAWEAGTYDGI